VGAVVVDANGTVSKLVVMTSMDVLADVRVTTCVVVLGRVCVTTVVEGWVFVITVVEE
jgi:hypothetical protein